MRDQREALSALKWCAGHSEKRGVHCNHMQSVVEGLVLERGLPESIETEEEAVAALLRDCACYESGTGNSNVTPYMPSRLSLPTDITGAPLLDSVVLAGPAFFLQGDYTHMLKGERELLELADHGPDLRPYMDVHLRRDAAQYEVFVKRLLELGIFQLTLRPAEEAACFFVKKKLNQQRLVIDCRRPNLRFRSAPGVSLATPEALAAVECTAPSGLWLAEADVDNCFHRIRIKESLGRYFAMPPLSAAALGVCSVSGTLVESSDSVWPCLAVAPMGWTWSLYFAQSINCDHVSDAVRPFSAQAVNAELPAVHLDGVDRRLAFFVYVDNVGILGTNPKEVEEALKATTESLDATGLLCKTDGRAHRELDILGVDFNNDVGGASAPQPSAIGGCVGCCDGCSDGLVSRGGSSR